MRCRTYYPTLEQWRPTGYIKSRKVEERDPACHIWSQVVANPEDVLFDVGKKLDAELSFHGDGPPDYILFGEEHGVSLGFNQEDGTLKPTRGVYAKRHE